MIIQYYKSIDTIDRQAIKLKEFLMRMGKEPSQGADGLVIEAIRTGQIPQSAV